MMLKLCCRCYSKLVLQKRLSSRFFSTKLVTSTRWVSKDVRQQFLDFFCLKNGHTFVRSSSVIPPKGQGTYFTNAGMNQFKPIFLGTVPESSDLAEYRRVANSQKCVRVGGKHNDLEDVGHDLTHHTFFEMLGSWSFGDYFKKEACSMALELLTDVYKIPIDRLYFTYFGGCEELNLPPDLECKDIWKVLGVPAKHILPFGMKDNFWDMGDTGPCGPCTEIHYDHVGGRDASTLVNMGRPDVVEIWNLVFMQYNRLGPEKLIPLPNTHVDTGMGLERTCAVLNGTMSNYNTDLFLPIFDVIQKETSLPVYQDQTGPDDIHGIDTAYRVLGDHSRMATVCICDGLLPGRLDLEHRLRIVIYRALYQCHQILKARPGLLSKLVDPVIDTLGDAYPEISVHVNKVKDVLDTTEDRFLKSHLEGKKNLEKLKKKHPGLVILKGEEIKKLHDGYYGNPMSSEMLEMIAPQYGLHVDTSDLRAFEELQHGSPVIEAEVQYPYITAELINDLINRHIPTTDDSFKYSYSKTSDGTYKFPPLETKLLCLVNDSNRVVERVSEGDRVGILFDRTSFYSERGGQAGDKGVIKTKTGVVEVEDTQLDHDYVLHTGTVKEGYVKPGQHATLLVDNDHRFGCMRNHTATHLLNAALRCVLGASVTQSGSSVLANKLTFDFSCWAAVTDDNIRHVEELVSSAIAADIPVKRELVPLKEAVNQEGVVYLDNVIYPSQVYTVLVKDEKGKEAFSSHELCGGTHVLSTGDLEDFCIISLQGQASGTKSVVCLTGQLASQAKHTAYKVQKLYEELENSVNRGSNLDISTELQKQIYTILGSEVLPKLFKDEMMTKMAAIGTSINTALNKQAFRKLEQDLKERMDGSEYFIVHQFAVKVLPKLNKMMKGLHIKKPLILVVETSNNTVAYIAFPKGREEMQSEVVTNFCEAVFGRVTQSEEKYKTVSVKGKHVEKFCDWAHRLLEDVPKKEPVEGTS